MVKLLLLLFLSSLSLLCWCNIAFWVVLVYPSDMGPLKESGTKNRTSKHHFFIFRHHFFFWKISDVKTSHTNFFCYAIDWLEPVSRRYDIRMMTMMIAPLLTSFLSLHFAPSLFPSVKISYIFSRVTLDESCIKRTEERGMMCWTRVWTSVWGTGSLTPDWLLSSPLCPSKIVLFTIFYSLGSYSLRLLYQPLEFSFHDDHHHHNEYQTHQKKCEQQLRLLCEIVIWEDDEYVWRGENETWSWILIRTFPPFSFLLCKGLLHQNKFPVETWGWLKGNQERIWKFNDIMMIILESHADRHHHNFAHLILPFPLDSSTCDSRIRGSIMWMRDSHFLLKTWKARFVWDWRDEDMTPHDHDDFGPLLLLLMMIIYTIWGKSVRFPIYSQLILHLFLTSDPSNPGLRFREMTIKSQVAGERERGSNDDINMSGWMWNTDFDTTSCVTKSHICCHQIFWNSNKKLIVESFTSQLISPCILWVNLRCIISGALESSATWGSWWSW